MIEHCFCIQHAELFHEYNLFLISPFYNGTSMFMDSIQIMIRQMLRVIFFFFQNSYNLTILLKHSFLSTFSHKSKTYSLKFRFLSITTPSSFFSWFPDLCFTLFCQNSYMFMSRTLQTHYVYSKLKQSGNGCFDVFSRWNKRDMFVGKHVNDNYPDLITYNYSQTTQQLGQYHVLAY